MFMTDTNEAWTSAICSLFTCAFIPGLLVYANYTESLYSLGEFSSGYFVVILFAAEIFKLLYIFSKSGESNKSTQSSKSLHTRSTSHAVPQFKIQDLLKLVIAVPASVLAFTAGIIMFGAPAMSNHEETIMLAVILTALTTFPLFVYTGVDNTIKTLSGQKMYLGEYIMEMLVQNVILTMFGAWGGAILIPLDWDRPWQTWPLPCAGGALAGYSLAGLITVVRMLPLLVMRIRG